MSPRWGALCFLNLLGFLLLFEFVVNGPEPRSAVQFVTGRFLFFVLGSPLLPVLHLIQFPIFALPVAIFVNAFLWATGVEWGLRRFVDRPLDSVE